MLQGKRERGFAGSGWSGQRDHAHHGTTHLVTPKLGRSEKTLAGMAAGAWILKESWLRESAKVNKALDEKKFLVESRDDTFVTSNAAELWHNRYKQTKRRAFETEWGQALR